MEQRKHHRIPLNVTASYSLDGGATWIQAAAKDISATGILITTDKTIEVGRTVRLSFKLAKVDKDHEIELNARVVRVGSPKGKAVFLALKFVTFGPGDEAVIQKYITKFR